MKKLIYLLLATITLAIASPVFAANNGAQDKAFLNDLVKAAFILNISRYVKWPEQLFKNRVQLCFLEENPLGAATSRIENKKVANQPLTIKLIPSLQADDSCHILFLSQAQVTQLSKEINEQQPKTAQTQYAMLRDKNTLIIADQSENSSDAHSLTGVMIFFVRKKTRIGLVISKEVLNSSQLKLSSELLKLSRLK